MEALIDVADVYKVVRPEGDRLVSAWTSLPGWETEYAKGLKAEPFLPQSFLFAFSSLEDARAFTYDSLTQIWLAVGESVKIAPSRIPVVGMGDLNRYWLYGRISGMHQRTSPDTVLCRAITLLEQVA